jgi:hypothetical protein
MLILFQMKKLRDYILTLVVEVEGGAVMISKLHGVIRTHTDRSIQVVLLARCCAWRDFPVISVRAGSEITLTGCWPLL